MKVANTVVKNKTNELLSGQAGSVAHRALRRQSEDFVLEHSPKVRKMLAEAEGDRKAGRVLPLAAYVAKARSR